MLLNRSIFFYLSPIYGDNGLNISFAANLLALKSFIGEHMKPTFELAWSGSGRVTTAICIQIYYIHILIWVQ